MHKSARTGGSSDRPLVGEESRTGAVEAIRALIEAIVLEPDGDRLKITLKGDLAGMLSAARDSKRSLEAGDLLLQIKLVAGARCRQYRLRCTWWPPDGRPSEDRCRLIASARFTRHAGRWSRCVARAHSTVKCVGT